MCAYLSEATVGAGQKVKIAALRNIAQREAPTGMSCCPDTFWTLLSSEGGLEALTSCLEAFPLMAEALAPTLRGPLVRPSPSLRGCCTPIPTLLCDRHVVLQAAIRHIHRECGRESFKAQHSVFTTPSSEGWTSFNWKLARARISHQKPGGLTERYRNSSNSFQGSRGAALRTAQQSFGRNRLQS